jgi:transcriptional regulator with XRE-family HTH domain
MMSAAKMTVEQALGCEIKKARESLKKSQQTLAFDAEVHRTYISLIERGQKSPTLAVIGRLAKALNVRPSELLRRVEARLEQSNS